MFLFSAGVFIGVGVFSAWLKVHYIFNKTFRLPTESGEFSPHFISYVWDQLNIVSVIITALAITVSACDMAQKWQANAGRFWGKLATTTNTAYGCLSGKTQVLHSCPENKGTPREDIIIILPVFSHIKNLCFKPSGVRQCFCMEWLLRKS